VSPLKLGVMVSLTDSPEDCIERVKSLDFPTCQVSIANPDLLDDAMASRLRHAADRLDVEITTIWTHCRRGQVWNFVDGPTTIGLVPIDGRPEAVERLKRGSDFAKRTGAITIEREVSGPAQFEGIALARRMLEPLL
jgi:L-ribulose-5-phosphate 3-epimerase